MRTWKNITAADFWESAKPSKIVGGKPEWMTFDDAWVDEVRRGFKACTVFVYYPLYCTYPHLWMYFWSLRMYFLRLLICWEFAGLAYNQIINNLTSQAATMVTNGVPNDVINNLDPFALIIFIPLCDLFVSSPISHPFTSPIGLWSAFTVLPRV